MSLASTPAEQYRSVWNLCANCERSPRPDERPARAWYPEPDGRGGYHVFCPECWQREFGSSG